MRPMHSGLIGTVLLASAALQSGTLTFAKPQTWTERPAASALRVAEFLVPRAAGDAEDGELIVFYFGGTGGSVEANIQRWIGQFQSTKEPVKESSTINGLKVTTVDVSGTYTAEVRPGASQRHNKPDFRMRASVVETPKGPYFIKLTGPAATVHQAGSTFDRFLNSLTFK